MVMSAGPPRWVKVSFQENSRTAPLTRPRASSWLSLARRLSTLKSCAQSPLSKVFVVSLSMADGEVVEAQEHLLEWVGIVGEVGGELLLGGAGGEEHEAKGREDGKRRQLKQGASHVGVASYRTGGNEAAAGWRLRPLEATIGARVRGRAC